MWSMNLSVDSADFYCPSSAVPTHCQLCIPDLLTCHVCIMAAFDRVGCYDGRVTEQMLEMVAGVEDAGEPEDGEQGPNIGRSKLGRIKRGFLRKVLSPVVGYTAWTISSSTTCTTSASGRLWGRRRTLPGSTISLSGWC